MTAVRRAQEQIGLFERRGARVDWAPALSRAPSIVDLDDLRLITRAVLARPIDLFLATTGIGMSVWFDAADTWGLGGELTAAIAGAEILARAPNRRAYCGAAVFAKIGRPLRKALRMSSDTWRTGISRAVVSFCKSMVSRLPWPRRPCAGVGQRSSSPLSIASTRSSLLTS